MWKYFTHHRTLRYVDILSKLVECYNHAYHRSIKCAPVTPKNEPQVSEILFGKSKLSKQQPKFKVGDYIFLYAFSTRFQLAKSNWYVSEITSRTFARYLDNDDVT